MRLISRWNAERAVIVEQETVVLTERETEKLWHETCDALGVHSADATSMWVELQSRHAEPHRHYHNMSHVAAMLGLLNTHRAELHDETGVFVAAFFHDAIYDPRAADNEQQSADLCVGWLSQYSNDAGRVSHARDLVLATAGHMSASFDGDVAWFLDADLAVLGARAAEYDSYAAAIRREYEFVPADAYRSGRSRVLQTFLDADAIYRTGLGRPLESQARENLQRELHSLDRPEQ